jgi:hypothetical protein
MLRINRLQECVQRGQQGNALHCTSQQEDTDSRRSRISGEILQDCLYFNLGDRSTLPLQEWRASRFTDYELLFGIYMEDVMRQICLGFTDRNVWYKLYADDLVLITSCQHLNSLLTSHNLKYQNISTSKWMWRGLICLLSKDITSWPMLTICVEYKS